MNQSKSPSRLPRLLSVRAVSEATTLPRRSGFHRPSAGRARRRRQRRGGRARARDRSEAGHAPHVRAPIARTPTA